MGVIRASGGGGASFIHHFRRSRSISPFTFIQLRPVL